MTLQDLEAGIAEKNDRIAELQLSIGRSYYERHKEDEDAEESMKIDEINTLNAEIAQLQEELGQAQEAFGQMQEAEVRMRDDVAPALPEAEAVPAPQLFCPACGEPLEADAVFCGNCGTPVTPAISAAPAGEIPGGGVPGGATSGGATQAVQGFRASGGMSHTTKLILIIAAAVAAVLIAIPSMFLFGRLVSSGRASSSAQRPVKILTDAMASGKDNTSTAKRIWELFPKEMQEYVAYTMNGYNDSDWVLRDISLHLQKFQEEYPDAKFTIKETRELTESEISSIKRRYVENYGVNFTADEAYRTTVTLTWDGGEQTSECTSYKHGSNWYLDAELWMNMMVGILRW